EKAIDFLRKKGMAVLEKRGDRETKEGRVVGQISDDGTTAVLVMLCCETDFTSKNEDFQNAAQLLTQSLLRTDQTPASTETLGQLEIAGGKKVIEVINDLISKIGEKITLAEFVRYDRTQPGLLKCYVHFNHKVATILQIDTDNDQTAQHQAVQELVNDLTMHITAANPQAVSREEVDPELIAREKEIAAAQVQNKPANIIEKIVTGKINKWFKQVVLLEQPFVKDDSKTVRQMLDDVCKQVDGEVTIRRFRRLQIG
ncbi:translation elongation factor Ts, partial [Planctomycetota bacterium]